MDPVEADSPKAKDGRERKEKSRKKWERRRRKEKKSLHRNSHQHTGSALGRVEK
ncbi:hypothetical protein K445DRAFT_321736 [Daldinia sp. EC12]|nr:hypothetical protein K445DRAFT_321736 [Daldinia sp. EC12]